MEHTRVILDCGWNLSDAAASATDFEELLRRHGISIAPGSPLEATILEVHALLEERRAGRLRPTHPGYRGKYRTIIGFREFASILLAAEKYVGFGALIPHLHLLNRGSALQSSQTSARDQAANKLFELFMACLILPHGTDLLLDDPKRSRGDNPDILVTIDGRRWGIACKVVHGTHPEGFAALLAAGIEQIQRSSACVGVVAISVKNILPHDDLWPLADTDDSPPVLSAGAYSTPQAAFDSLYSAMTSIGTTLAAYLPEDALEALFRGKKSLPGYLLWGASPTAAFIDGRPHGVNPRTLHFHACGPLAERDATVLKRWQKALLE